MIEPTETESRQTLDRFVEAMREIAREATDSPERLREAPTETPVRRLDEVRAARQPVFCHAPLQPFDLPLKGDGRREGGDR